MNRNPKTKKLHRVQIALLAAAVCCGSAAVGTSLAKMASGDGDFGRTRASSFVIETSAVSTENLSLNADKTSDSCTFTVSNHREDHVSEAAIKYSVTVTLPERLNDEIQMNLFAQDGSEIPTASQSEDGLVYTYEAGSFKPVQAEQNEFRLEFAAENGLTQDFTMNGIEISVCAEQTN